MKKVYLTLAGVMGVLLTIVLLWLGCGRDQAPDFKGINSPTTCEKPAEAGS